MSSLEFARAYRQTAPPRAPIVVTAPREQITVFAALTGAAALLPSPFTPDDLTSTINRLLTHIA